MLQHFISILVSKRTKVIDRYTGLFEFKTIVMKKKSLRMILPTICHVSKSLLKKIKTYTLEDFKC